MSTSNGGDGSITNDINLESVHIYDSSECHAKNNLVYSIAMDKTMSME